MTHPNSVIENTFALRVHINIETWGLSQTFRQHPQTIKGLAQGPNRHVTIHVTMGLEPVTTPSQTWRPNSLSWTASPKLRFNLKVWIWGEGSTPQSHLTFQPQIKTVLGYCILSVAEGEKHRDLSDIQHKLLPSEDHSRLLLLPLFTLKFHQTFGT